MTWISSGFCLDKNIHGHFYTNAKHYIPSVLLKKKTSDLRSILHQYPSEISISGIHSIRRHHFDFRDCFIASACAAFLPKRGFLHLSGSDSGHSLQHRWCRASVMDAGVSGGSAERRDACGSLYRTSRLAVHQSTAAFLQ